MSTNEKKPETTEQTQPKTDAALMQENEMLNARLKVREKQLEQAVDIANRANEQNKAKDNAQKEMLIASLQRDGQFTKEELAAKTLPELTLMQTTIDKVLNKTFASVAAEIDEAKRLKQSRFTGGWWDSKAGAWKT